MEKTLAIHEIYRSIQGESTRAGLPCVLVRLSGCDLRCSYCDSESAFSQGENQSIKHILDEVEKLSTEMVEITGGEPLLQSNVHELMKQLCDRKKLVLLETSGAHDISSVDSRVIRIVDIKCPSSGESNKNHWKNIEHLQEKDEVKFVVGNRNDFDWSLDVVRRHDLTKTCPVLFSATWKKLPLETLAEWIRDSGESIRLQPQLHKILWGATPST